MGHRFYWNENNNGDGRSGIDRLVYDLYDLTLDEIKMVEGGREP